MMVALSDIEPLVYNQDTMLAYVAMFEEGKEVPPIVLCTNRNRRWRWRIFDGANRIAACEHLKRATIEARVIKFEGS